MPVEKVRNAIGDDTSASACGCICVNEIPVSIRNLRPVITHHTNVHAGVRALEPVDSLPSGAPFR